MKDLSLMKEQTENLLARRTNSGIKSEQIRANKSASCVEAWLGSSGRVSVLLDGEEDVAGEEAVSGQAVAPVVGAEEDPVPSHQLQNSAPGGRHVAVLLRGKGVQHQLVVVPQVHVAHVLVERAVEVELVDAGLHAGEHARLGVVQVLAVVDDALEGDGFAREGEVVAQAHGEGGVRGAAGWAWGARGSLRKTGEVKGQSGERSGGVRLWRHRDVGT